MLFYKYNPWSCIWVTQAYLTYVWITRLEQHQIEGYTQLKLKALDFETTRLKLKTYKINRQVENIFKISRLKLKAYKSSRLKLKACKISRLKLKACKISRLRLKACKISRLKLKACKISRLRLKACKISKVQWYTVELPSERPPYKSCNGGLKKDLNFDKRLIYMLLRLKQSFWVHGLERDGFASGWSFWRGSIVNQVDLIYLRLHQVQTLKRWCWLLQGKDLWLGASNNNVFLFHLPPKKYLFVSFHFF